MKLFVVIFLLSSLVCHAQTVEELLELPPISSELEPRTPEIEMREIKLPREQLLDRLNQVILLGDKGNGGDAVVCRNENDKITKAELLDHYEARVIHHTKAAKHDQLDLMSYVNLVAQRLESCNRRVYRGAVKEVTRLAEAIEDYQTSGRLEQRGVLFSRNPLSNVNDSKHELNLGESCALEQLVVRLDANRGYAFEYAIQADILDGLKSSGVQGIVLHEVIYKLRKRSLGEQNSRPTRSIIQLIYGLSLAEIRSEKFCQLL